MLYYFVDIVTCSTVRIIHKRGESGLENILEDDYKNRPELYSCILRKINAYAVYSFDDWRYSELISKIMDENYDALKLTAYPNKNKLVLHGVVVDVKLDNGNCKLTIVDDKTFELYRLATLEELHAAHETMIVASADGEYTIGASDKVEPGTKVYLCFGWVEAFAKCSNVLFATVFDIAAVSKSEHLYIGANGRFCTEDEFIELYSQERKAVMEAIDSIKN